MGISVLHIRMYAFIHSQTYSCTWCKHICNIYTQNADASTLFEFHAFFFSYRIYINWSYRLFKHVKHFTQFIIYNSSSWVMHLDIYAFFIKQLAYIASARKQVEVKQASWDHRMKRVEQNRRHKQGKLTQRLQFTYLQSKKEITRISTYRYVYTHTVTHLYTYAHTHFFESNMLRVLQSKFKLIIDKGRT